MPTHSAELRVATQGDGDVVDLTAGIGEVVQTSGARDGVVHVFVAHSTAAVTTIEYEPGAVQDLQAATEELVPRNRDYHHNRMAGDTNAHAHVRAALIGPSETLPLRGGRLVTGTWQQVVLIDFDDRPRERTVTVQVLS